MNSYRTFLNYMMCLLLSVPFSTGHAGKKKTSNPKSQSEKNKVALKVYQEECVHNLIRVTYDFLNSWLDKIPGAGMVEHFEDAKNQNALYIMALDHYGEDWSSGQKILQQAYGQKLWCNFASNLGGASIQRFSKKYKKIRRFFEAIAFGATGAWA